MPLTAASEGRHHVDQGNTAEPPTRHAGYFREQADHVSGSPTRRLIRTLRASWSASEKVTKMRRRELGLKRLSPADLAPLDQFHTRGLAATIELTEAAGIARGAKVLDIGSGLIPSGAMLEGREEQCRYAR
jgi:hypothetical protein